MPRVTFTHHEDTVVVEERSESRIHRFLGAASDAVLYALVFLLPLFFIAGLQDGVELPKQILLLTLTTLVGVLWLVRVFLSRSLTIRKSFLFFPIILFVLGIGIGTITSVDRYTSLFGGALGEYASMATLVGFFLFLFFTVASDRDLRFVRRALIAFTASSIVLFGISVLKLFGVAVPGVPGNNVWNFVGSSYALGIFAAVVILLVSGLLLFESKEHVFLKGKTGVMLHTFAIISGILGLFYLLVLDWWVAWVITLIGTGLLLLFVFVYAHTFRHLARLLLPLITLVFAILFLFIRTPVVANFPVEVAPGLKVGWSVAQDVLQEYPAFGSGPATYGLEYVKYQPEVFTTTPLWNVRFDRAGSAVLTWLPTTGLAGAILWILLVIMMIGLVVHSFLRERDPTAWLLSVTLFFPWIGLVIASFLYSSNMTLGFLFWFFTALLVIATSRNLSLFTFQSSPRALLSTSLGAVVFAVLMIILMLLGVARYTAWAAFGRAVQASASGDSVAMQTELLRAVDHDPRTDVFVRNVAQARLLKAAQAESLADLRTELNHSVAAARQAVTVGPKNSVNWAMLGGIYREMASVVTGSGELGLQAYERAMELEPRNPVHPTQMGRIHLVLSDRAMQAEERGQADEHLADAERFFQSALDRKLDYAPAHFYLAATLDRQGKIAEAITKMEAVMQYNPQDIGALFQLSLLYLKNKEISKAETALVRSVQLAPNYANAHWYLASIYESRKEFDKAIAEIEAVLATNPDNADVEKRLEALRAGKSGTGLPEPIGPAQADEDKFPR